MSHLFKEDKDENKDKNWKIKRRNWKLVISHLLKRLWILPWFVCCRLSIAPAVDKVINDLFKIRTLEITCKLFDQQSCLTRPHCWQHTQQTSSRDRESRSTLEVVSSVLFCKPSCVSCWLQEYGNIHRHLLLEKYIFRKTVDSPLSSQEELVLHSPDILRLCDLLTIMLWLWQWWEWLWPWSSSLPTSRAASGSPSTPPESSEVWCVVFPGPAPASGGTVTRFSLSFPSINNYVGFLLFNVPSQIVWNHLSKA